MPAKCSIPGCPTKAQRGSGPRFYCIPSGINFTGKASPLRASRRKKWIAALKLQHFSDAQIKNIRICGRHFVTGKPADQYFVHHPDWAPSQHLDERNQSSKTQFLNKLHLDGTPKKQLSPAKKHHSSSSGSEDASHDINVDEGSKYSMPQKRCCVASCLNRISKTKNSTPPIYYHKFPEDPLTKNRWMFLCQKKGTWDPLQSYICSEHFLPEDFIKEGQLKPAAVPKINLLPSETDKKGAPSMIHLEGKSGVCSVPWCKSKISEDNHMELFPQSEDNRKLWVERICGAKVPVAPSENSYVCQEHFSDDQWLVSPKSSEKTLKEEAAPSIFVITHIPATPSSGKDKVLDKRKSESINEKEPKTKKIKVESSSFRTSDDEKLSISHKKEGSKHSLNSVKNGEESHKKSVKVVKLVKNKFLGDHTYSGLDSIDDGSKSNDVDNGKKRKVEVVKKLNNNNKIMKRETNSQKELEDLMADLMGEDDQPESIKTSPNSGKKSEKLSLSLNDDASDSLGDYSDYSETDSESESGQPLMKPISELSQKELKELAEAQKDQLEDLTSENKELIEENDKLRKAIDAIQTDPEFSNINLEKNKFLSLMMKLFRNFLNEDQVLSLIKSANPSSVVAWTGETLTKALKIRQTCTEEGYDLLLDYGFPLPPRRLLSMLDRDEPSGGKSSDST